MNKGSHNAIPAKDWVEPDEPPPPTVKLDLTENEMTEVYVALLYYKVTVAALGYISEEKTKLIQGVISRIEKTSRKEIK